MSIRWRLAILALQLGILAGVTYWITGRPYAIETWFGAGMLALIINPQILEPFFTGPRDVVGNALLGIALFLTATKDQFPIGWKLLLAFLIVSLALGLAALVFGASKKEGSTVGLGRAATVLAKVSTSRVIYSAVFFLSLLEFRDPTHGEFWILAATWMIINWLGVVNWQAAWGSLSGGPLPCSAEGMIGPALLLVSSPMLPAAGTSIKLVTDGRSVDGVILHRIHRDNDYWGQVHVSDPDSCELLARKKVISISTVEKPKRLVVGAVLSPSTDNQLQFVSTQDLETGSVVAVADKDAEVFYQIRAAVIEDRTVKGGAHQVVRAHASQLGVFDSAALRLKRHRWVPRPGGAVFVPNDELTALPTTPESWLRLGFLIGTVVPLFVDCDAACEGHIAILGMTRMGKTTLALRLARHLAPNRRVTILDQTGEWTAKKGLPAYAGPQEDSKPGLSVLEPKAGTNAPDEALKYLKSWVNLAYVEYKKGAPLPRVLIMDEAHQFVPEPAGLGFNAPGRESAAAFGMLMMQVRKYGISIVLISQRTAVIAKSALSQCENVIAFKSVDQTGLEYLEAILGPSAREALPALRHGEALIFGPAISSELTAGIAVDAN